ncbi:MAG: P-type conjugative transfer protein TrbG [Pseudoxanthomonas mexicana]|nr:P-type conjugative transfer protein TrbG [Pseudoxanthomonas mexicana]
MNRTIALAALCLALGACASTRPAPEIGLDEPVEIEAVPVPEPPAPVQVVEVPIPLPLPGQLKPLPEKRSPVIADPIRTVAAANRAARIEPAKDGFVDAMQVWPYSDGALYQVYASPGRVTDIALQPGEQLVSVSAGDTVRWIIGDTESGSGADKRVHVLVKPSRAELGTNLVINTDRRSYYLELSATPGTWLASVAWEYPQDLVHALRARGETTPTPIEHGIALDRLRFRYAITGDTPSWRPLRAFDDGRQVFIQFPAAIGQGELPPLFVVGAGGDAQLVNYRVRSPYLIVDRLFGAAELRLGGKQPQVVHIERNDGARSR